MTNYTIRPVDAAGIVGEALFRLWLWMLDGEVGGVRAGGGERDPLGIAKQFVSCGTECGRDGRA